MRLTTVSLAVLVVLGSTVSAAAQEPSEPASSPTGPASSPTGPASSSIETASPSASEAPSPSPDPATTSPSAPVDDLSSVGTSSKEPAPAPSTAGPTTAGQDAVTEGSSTQSHDLLRAAVVRATVDEGRLPLAPDASATCPADSVELTWVPVPEGSFAVGGYVEPLIEPTVDAPDRATGIAVCAESSHAVAGFDAFRNGGEWDVLFVAPMVDEAHHDEAGGHGDAQLRTFDAATSSSSSSAAAGPPGWPSGMPTVAEPLASYDGQDVCDPTDKPGAVALADLITAHYGSSYFGISRNCSSGGRSEHKEGRAVDWMVNAYDATERQMGDEFTSWLLSTDPWGNEYAGMRRLGIMYMIWNRQAIQSWTVDEGWRAYTGSSPHTDHVHFSMSWEGARCQTSFWEATGCTGTVTEAATGNAAPDTRGDFDGDGRSDVLWYGPGTGKDTMWFGRPDGFRTRVNTTVNGIYEPVTGDFNGDGSHDILWYGPGSSYDSRWDGTASPGVFDKALWLRVKGVYEPFVGDFDGDGNDDVFWYGPGSSYDSVWFGNGNDWVFRTYVDVSGIYRPAVGDFDGDGNDDILWYGPGSDPDHLWLGRDNRTFRSPGVRSVGVDAQPITGDFDGDGFDDIFFYGPGSRRDVLWRGDPEAQFARTQDQGVMGEYRPFAGDFDGDGRSDIFWYGPNAEPDWMYYGTSSGFRSVETLVKGDYEPISGG